ncbi:MAG TPA: class I SAM-dependent methyltransferase [Dehalococcoidia bacterium]|nr:class I SAM-dependent methyltransferase [Dehalococcoidia bacterium]
MQGERPARILDVGCGTGSMLERWEAFGKPVGLDHSIEALGFCRRRGLETVCLADPAETLPFRDESFEVISLLDLLEHVNEDLATLRELRRVLMPDRCLVISVPAYRGLWSSWD